jgi:hypothetical protein
MCVPHEVQMSCWIEHQVGYTSLNPKPNGGENRGVDRASAGIRKPI